MTIIGEDDDALVTPREVAGHDFNQLHEFWVVGFARVGGAQRPLPAVARHELAGGATRPPDTAVAAQPSRVIDVLRQPLRLDDLYRVGQFERHRLHREQLVDLRGGFGAGAAQPRL